MTAGAAPNGADATPRSDRFLGARRRRRLLLPLFLLAGAVLLGGCNAPSFFAFRGATTQGHDIFKLWSGMMITGIVVAVIVWGLIFWTIVRYRRRRDDEIPRQFHSNVIAEIIYTGLPIIIVGFLFYFTVVTENEVDAETPTPAAEVHVIAYRWGWRFVYLDRHGKSTGVVIETTGEPTPKPLPATNPAYPQLLLPDHATIRIIETSADVVHEFWVPEFDFGRFAQPGHTNSWDFTTTTNGTFRGQCAEYCGLYHAEMLFTVKVEPASKFNAWLTGQERTAKSGGLS